MDLCPHTQYWTTQNQAATPAHGDESSAGGANNVFILKLVSQNKQQ